MFRLPACLALLLVSQLAVAADDAFAKWEKEVSGIENRNRDASPGGVIFYGSSSIRLWDLKKSFPDQPYLNAGFGGSKIEDCIHFAKRLVLVHKPSVIVFYAGDNDIGAGQKPEQVRANFEKFVETVHKELPKCKILYIPVKPSLKRWAKFDTQKEANAMVKEVCSKNDLLTYIDIVSPMLGTDGKPIPDLFVKDGLHMTPKGYEIWTTAVNKALGK